jgi:hypothetical protein
MSNVLEASADELKDEVHLSMRERVLDIWRAQGQWPFPRYEQGRVVRLRRVIPPIDIDKLEEALL